MGCCSQDQFHFPLSVIFVLINTATLNGDSFIIQVWVRRTTPRTLPKTQPQNFKFKLWVRLGENLFLNILKALAPQGLGLWSSTSTKTGVWQRTSGLSLSFNIEGELPERSKKDPTHFVAAVFVCNYDRVYAFGLDFDLDQCVAIIIKNCTNDVIFIFSLS